MRGPGLTQVPLHLTTDQGQSSMAVDGLAQHIALLPTRVSPIAKGLAEISRKDGSSEFRLCLCHGSQTVMGQELTFLILKWRLLGLCPKTGIAGGAHSLASVWDCPVQCRGTLIPRLLSAHCNMPPTQLPIQI